MTETSTEIIAPAFEIRTRATTDGTPHSSRRPVDQQLTLTSLNTVLVARLVDYGWERLTVDAGATPAGDVSVKATIDVLGAPLELAGIATVENSRFQKNGICRLTLKFKDGSWSGRALGNRRVA